MRDALPTRAPQNRSSRSRSDPIRSNPLDWIGSDRVFEKVGLDWIGSDQENHACWIAIFGAGFHGRTILLQL